MNIFSKMAETVVSEICEIAMIIIH